MIYELITGFIFGVIISAVFPQFPKFIREALNKRNKQKQVQSNKYLLEDDGSTIEKLY
jgi:hypothetical protein